MAQNVPMARALTLEFDPSHAVDLQLPSERAIRPETKAAGRLVSFASRSLDQCVTLVVNGAFVFQCALNFLFSYHPLDMTPGHYSL